MVVGSIAGPTTGPVPNAGGDPGGAAGGPASPASAGAAATPTRPIAEPFKNCLRELAMGPPGDTTVPSARDLENLVLVGRAGAAPVAVRGGDVELAVGAHDHVAQPAVAVGQVHIVLRRPLPVGVEDDPVEVARPQRRHQDAPGP